MSKKQAPEEKDTYVINLSRIYWGRRSNRAARAIRYIRQWVARRTKAKRVIIDEEVNRLVWSRGIEKPPRRIKVKIVKDEQDVETKRVKPRRKSDGREASKERTVVISVEKVIVKLYKKEDSEEKKEAKASQ